MLWALPGFAAQQPKSLLTAKGKGQFKVGSEQFEIHSVVIKLMEDGTAELTLVSEITVFLSGKWKGGNDVQKGIDLEITGGATPGGIEGSGKLFLRKDEKSIDRLNLQGASRTSSKKVEVTFVAD